MLNRACTFYQRKMYEHAELELQWLHIILNPAFIWRDSISYCRFLGNFFLRYCFKLAQMHSTGFISGDSGLVGQWLISCIIFHKLHCWYPRFIFETITLRLIFEKV